MKYRLAIILSVLLFSCSTLLKAQGNMDDIYNTLKIEPNKLKQDIDTLFIYLEDIHPELFEIHSKEKFQFTIDSIKSTIVEPLNAAEYYLKLLPVFQLERDGHTFVNYPTTISDTLDQQGLKFFPFKVSFLKKKIYITENYTSSAIPEYAEIISINGVPTETIVRTFETIESFDRYEALEPYMSYFFKHLLYPLFGLHNQFEIEYSVNSVIEKITVSGISLKEYPTIPYEYFRFSIDSTKEFAILDLNLCEGYDRFPSFCDSVFRELKKQQIPNLIIDLRRNTGGTTRHGDTLVTYLTDKKFTQYPRTEFKRSKLLDNSLDSSFVEKFSNDIAIAHKNPNLYQGEIFVFIDVFTFSSATVLAGTIQCYDLGTVIGQESGGTQIMYSAFHELYLPHSDLFVGISTEKRYIPCGKERFRGVIPDYQIDYSIEDRKLKKDLEMEYFMELITAKK